MTPSFAINLHVVAGHRDHVESRSADAILCEDAIEHFGRATAPIFHLQVRFFSRRLFSGVGGEGFHRGVKNDLAAFFLRRGDRSAPIGRRRMARLPGLSNRQLARNCSHRKFLSHDTITARQRIYMVPVAVESRSGSGCDLDSTKRRRRGRSRCLPSRTDDHTGSPLQECDGIIWPSMRLKNPSRSSSSRCFRRGSGPMVMSTLTLELRCAVISRVLRKPSWETRVGKANLLAKY